MKFRNVACRRFVKANGGIIDGKAVLGREHGLHNTGELKRPRNGSETILELPMATNVRCVSCHTPTYNSISISCVGTVLLDHRVSLGAEHDSVFGAGAIPSDTKENRRLPRHADEKSAFRTKGTPDASEPGTRR